MRTALIVVATPGLDLPPGLAQCLERVQVQALVAQRAVEGLDEGVVGRLARPGEVNPRAVVVGLMVDEAAGELRAAVHKRTSRRSAFPHEAVQHLDHVLAPPSLSHFDGQPFAAEHIDHRQGAELLPVTQLVPDEVSESGRG